MKTEHLKHIKNPNPKTDWQPGDYAYYISPVTGLIAYGKLHKAPRSDIQAEINGHIMNFQQLFESHEAIQKAFKQANIKSPYDEFDTSPVKIHDPDGCHTYGIEFNVDPKYAHSDATEFVNIACRVLLYPGSGWFWQSGSNSNKTGYQFFEYWGKDAKNTVFDMARKIANALGVQLV